MNTYSIQMLLIVIVSLLLCLLLKPAIWNEKVGPQHTCYLLLLFVNPFPCRSRNMKQVNMCLKTTWKGPNGKRMILECNSKTKDEFNKDQKFKLSFYLRSGSALSHLYFQYRSARHSWRRFAKLRVNIWKNINCSPDYRY